MRSGAESPRQNNHCVGELQVGRPASRKTALPESVTPCRMRSGRITRHSYNVPTPSAARVRALTDSSRETLSTETT